MLKSFLNLSTVFIYLFSTYTVIFGCSPTDVGNIVKGGGSSGNSGGVLARKTGGMSDFASVPNKDDARQAKSPDDLSCSSRETSRGCCWRDASMNVGDGGPPEIDFRALAGQGDSKSMGQHFENFRSVPDGPGVIAAYTEGKVDRSETAALESCVICLEDPSQPISLSVSQWATPGTTLEACVTPASPYDPQNCQSVDVGSQTVQVQPLDEPFRLVLRAGTFTQPDGSIVAMDDLSVRSGSRFRDCTEDPPPPPVVQTQPPPTQPALNCGAVVCSFDQGSPCSYDTAAGGTSWRVTDQLTGNMNTGVRKAASGSEPYYAGVNVPKGGKAIMKSRGIGAANGAVVKFKAYEATENILLKACIDGESNCCWRSNPTVSFADTKWLAAECRMPPGSNELWFVAENVGQQYGAAGIDDIMLYDANGNRAC